jgi:hypothetical protein
MNLPRPKIKRCCIENNADASVSCMELQWDLDAPGIMERAWHLPDGVVLQGPAPARFGIIVHRIGKDSYRVRLSVESPVPELGRPDARANHGQLAQIAPRCTRNRSLASPRTARAINRGVVPITRREREAASVRFRVIDR